ncbi:hypothetical protein L5515_010223 [Caenorhabditis briggsae]|uniref:Uncharacterized protein n=1 Tax=Caenorhabditis briggsae TaxID=6238 RepID=A0AAE9JCX2_CAEBR|nr:hypothetical protein L5515_010223 [Caenorhabditis briggsae]
MDGGGVQGSVMFFDLHADQHTKDGEYITNMDPNPPKPFSASLPVLRASHILREFATTKCRMSAFAIRISHHVVASSLRLLRTAASFVWIGR